MSVSRYANVGQRRSGRHPTAARCRTCCAGSCPRRPAGDGRRTYQVQPGDRVDMIANSALGDPTLSWLLADANLVDAPDPAQRSPGTCS